MSEHFEVKYNKNSNFHFKKNLNFQMLFSSTLVVHYYIPRGLHLEPL